jgi:hypothetical protein
MGIEQMLLRHVCTSIMVAQLFKVPCQVPALNRLNSLMVLGALRQRLVSHSLYYTHGAAPGAYALCIHLIVLRGFTLVRQNDLMKMMCSRLQHCPTTNHSIHVHLKRAQPSSRTAVTPS